MLAEICSSINNFFVSAYHFGVTEIKDGEIAVPDGFLKEGQYFRIIGSTFNDGVHQYPACNLTDETFSGAVWAMAVPADFLAVCQEIEQYTAENKPGAYTSESFGGYSYTRATGSDGAPLSWQAAFRSRLTKWRKLR